MVNIEKKDKIQKQALKAWVDAGKIASISLHTGSGKSFVGLHALYTMPLDKSITHLFLAEVIDRERDILVEIKKYNKIFNRDVLGDYNLEFSTYQTACKWRDKSFGLVIGDEIVDSLSPIYSNFYRYNNYDALIGLAAYYDTETQYDNGKTKGDYLNKIAPICYSFGVDEGIDEGTARKLNIYAIEHHLDYKNRNIKAGSKFKPFMQSEGKAYEYWDTQFNKLTNREYKKPDNMTPKEYYDFFTAETEKLQGKLFSVMSRRSNLLYDLPSKIRATKYLLDKIKGKVIIFGNSINSLLAVTKNTVSSRNKEDRNNAIRDAFEQDKIRVIGSFKKLAQGANLSSKLNSMIMMSYYSKQKSVLQRAGRLRENGKIGNVFIFVTKNTQEEVWFKKMFEDIENYNFIYCKNVDEVIQKLYE